jgi:hypothetical protein
MYYEELEQRIAYWSETVVKIEYILEISQSNENRAQENILHLPCLQKAIETEIQSLDREKSSR